MESLDSFLIFSNSSSSGSDGIRGLDQIQGKDVTEGGRLAKVAPLLVAAVQAFEESKNLFRELRVNPN